MIPKCISYRSLSCTRHFSSCSSAFHAVRILLEQQLISCSTKADDMQVPARYIGIAKQVQTINMRALTVCMRAQVDQLADMVSAVFMVHSASQLDVFNHLNTSHAITAAELAVDIFWKQVSLLCLPVVTPTITMPCIESASTVQKALHLPRAHVLASSRD